MTTYTGIIRWHDERGTRGYVLELYRNGTMIELGPVMGKGNYGFIAYLNRNMGLADWSRSGGTWIDAYRFIVYAAWDYNPGIEDQIRRHLMEFAPYYNDDARLFVNWDFAPHTGLIYPTNRPDTWRLTAAMPGNRPLAVSYFRYLDEMLPRRLSEKGLAGVSVTLEDMRPDDETVHEHYRRNRPYAAVVHGVPASHVTLLHSVLQSKFNVHERYMRPRSVAWQLAGELTPA